MNIIDIVKSFISNYHIFNLKKFDEIKEENANLKIELISSKLNYNRILNLGSESSTDYFIDTFEDSSNIISMNNCSYDFETGTIK